MTTLALVPATHFTELHLAGAGERARCAFPRREKDIFFFAFCA
jgi:hypothetical protein